MDGLSTFEKPGENNVEPQLTTQQKVDASLAAIKKRPEHIRGEEARIKVLRKYGVIDTLPSTEAIPLPQAKKLILRSPKTAPVRPYVAQPDQPELILDQNGAWIRALSDF